MTLFNKIPLLFIILFSYALSGCLQEHQRPADTFVDAKFPSLLNEKANPSPLSQIQVDSTGKLAVAVIDNGVDYNHSWLKNRVRYQWKDGAIQGAGFDILGQDSWAHPNLVDASLFAFAAKEVIEGRISEPAADPVVALREVNKKFQAQLKIEMQKSAEFKKSIFANLINEKSIGVVGARVTAAERGKNLEEFIKYRDEYYADQPEEAWKSYVKASDLQDPEKKKYFVDYHGLYTYRKIFENPWYMSSSTNLPNVQGGYGIYELQMFYDYPVFVEVVSKAYDTVKAEYENVFQPYFDFHFFREDVPNKKADDYAYSYDQKLSEVLYQEYFGYSYLDPLLTYRDQFCRNLSEADLYKLQSAVATEDDKLSIVTASLTKLFQMAEKTDQFVVSYSKTTPQDKENAEKQLKGYKQLQQFLELVVKNRGANAFGCLLEAPNNLKYWPKYAAAFEEESGSYYSFSNASESHGTHVAGVIAAQSENIEIVPVRVITASTQAQKDRDEEAKQNYINGLKNWIALPPVYTLIKSRYSVEFGLKALELNEQPKAEDIEVIFNTMVKTFNINYDYNRLDYLFFEEIIDAIKYIGQQQVKIANMSLGTKVERGVSDGNEVDINEVFSILDFEYMKYKIGAAIKQHADKTLFVIAAGNDGNWIDGQTRSALPCDISSPYLKDIPQGSELPNNKIDNVLCVGSIGPKGDLSPFTNILLTDTPMIFAIGEAVQSTMKTTDCSGADVLFDRRYQTPYYPYFEEMDDELKKFFNDLGLLPADYDSLDEEKKQEAFYKATAKMDGKLYGEMNSLVGMAKKHFCLRRYVNTAPMSGTSMASPGVAGYVGQWLLQKMEEKGLTESDVYNLPEFAPAKMIDDVTKESPKFGSSILKSHKVDKLKTIESLKPLSDWILTEDGELKKRDTTGYIFIEKL